MHLITSVLWLQLLISLSVTLTLAGLSIFCLYHAYTTPAQAFYGTSKQSRNFWISLNIASLVLALLAMPPAHIVGFTFSLFGFVIPGVYLADVRGAVEPWRRKNTNQNGPYGQRPPTNW